MRVSASSVFLLPAALAISFAAFAQAETRAREPEPLRIRIVDANICFDADQFYREVAARTPLVRRANDGESARTIVAEVRVRGRAIDGSVRLEDEAHQTRARTFHAATCGEALSAMALVAALSIDPQARAEMTTAAAGSGASAQAASIAVPTSSDAGVPEAVPVDAATSLVTGPSDAGPPDAVSAPEPVRPTPPASAEPEPPHPATVFPEPPAGAVVPTRAAFEPRSGWTFAVGGSVDVVGPDGFSGSVAFAPRVFLEAVRSGAGAFAPSLRLQGERLTGATVTSTLGYSASPSWLTADLSFCPVRVLRATVSACADFEAGSIHFDATGSETSGADRPWLAAGVLARVSWPALALTERISLAFDVELGVRFPFGRDEFYFLKDPNNNEIYTDPAIVPHGAFDVAVRFW